MKKVSDSRGWNAAQTVFDFFKKETDCFDDEGKLNVVPRYVVAFGSDMISAYNASIIMKKALSQCGFYPTLLCCGHLGFYSKYLNKTEGDAKILTDGEKLQLTAKKLLGEVPTMVIDEDRTVSQFIETIADLIDNDGSSVIFCPSPYMSLILERMVVYQNQVRPGRKICASWFVPKVATYHELLQYYNGFKIAGGLPLLSIAVYVYNQLSAEKMDIRQMADLDEAIPKYVRAAGIYLRDKYSLLLYPSSLSNLMQKCRIKYDFMRRSRCVTCDLDNKIAIWKQNL